MVAIVWTQHSSPGLACRLSRSAVCLYKASVSGGETYLENQRKQNKIPIKMSWGFQLNSILCGILPLIYKLYDQKAILLL